MRLTLLIVIILISLSGFTNVVVIDKKAFKLTPIGKKICGVKGGPVFTAERLLMDMTFNLGINFSQAQCGIGVESLCNQKNQKKYALKSLFNFTRQFPPSYKSEQCKELRKLGCTDICINERIYNEEHCLIECNQYESYNR
jgi:hypothetical protein